MLSVHVRLHTGVEDSHNPHLMTIIILSGFVPMHFDFDFTITSHLHVRLGANHHAIASSSRVRYV